ncbi:unnamed protein product [Lasius platythorax]|uniref:Uncharacterized protein n=1 Tax=Lasius platythorax TaxID=488582 RepID=A0AAV2NEF7_9HYME
MPGNIWIPFDGRRTNGNHLETWRPENYPSCLRIPVSRCLSYSPGLPVCLHPLLESAESPVSLLSRGC